MCGQLTQEVQESMFGPSHLLRVVDEGDANARISHHSSDTTVDFFLIELCIDEETVHSPPRREVEAAEAVAPPAAPQVVQQENGHRSESYVPPVPLDASAHQFLVFPVDDLVGKLDEFLRDVLNVMVNYGIL